MLSSGTLGFCNTFFRNHQCPLWKRFTVLSKLMHYISKIIFNYFQITGYLLHFIPTIIDTVIFRRVDNKEFNIFNKYMVHDTKLFLFFNPSFQWIHFLYICIGLSPQLLMAYLYRHSSDQHDFLIDSMPILWDSICNDMEATVEQNSGTFQSYNQWHTVFQYF